MSPEGTDPNIGRVLDGRYHVVARVAGGGMATVYQAHDTRLDRTVAVKLMRPELATDSSFSQRFLREARSAAALSHSGIVPIHDQGSDEGLLYLVMEYVAGTNLRDLLNQRGALPPNRALDVLERITSAIAVAHEHDIIHRDIKPENVLIGLDRSIKVADFGLARPLGEGRTLTAIDTVIGTVDYLAPEQIEKGTADKRTDVYACGIVLFELLTNQKPFEAGTAAALAYQHVNSDVPLPSTVVPGLPPVVDELVQLMTCRNPDGRPADAGAVGELIGATRGQLDTPVDDPGLVEDLTMVLSRVPKPAPTRPLTVPVDAGQFRAPGTPSGQQHVAHAGPPGGHPQWSATPPGQLGAGPMGPGPMGPGQMAPGPMGPGPGGPGPMGSGPAGPGQLGPAPMGPGPAPMGAMPMGPGPGQRPAAKKTSGAMVGGIVALVLVLLAASGVGGYLVYKQTVDDGKDLASDTSDGPDAGSDDGGSNDGGSDDDGDATPDPTPTPSPTQQEVVPALMGDTVAQATQELAERNLQVGTQTQEYHPTYDAGEVIRTDPRAVQLVAPGTKVNLVVSKGEDPVDSDVPPDSGPSPAPAALDVLSDGTVLCAKLYEVRHEDARRLLTAAGVNVTTAIEDKDSSVYARGTIMDLKPSMSGVKQGDTVTMVVSTGSS